MQSFALGKRIALNDKKKGLLILNVELNGLSKEYCDQNYFRARFMEFFMDKQILYALDCEGRVYRIY